MNKILPTYHWYAVYTQSKKEKKVFAEINKTGVTAYLPLRTVMSQWSDRKKKVQQPLIHSYVFVKVSEIEYHKILSIPGVVRYVCFGGKAAPIPEWQIEAMQKILASDISHTYSGEVYMKGEMVTIISGPLKGYEGEVVKDINGKTKFIIRISNIGYSLVIENTHGAVKRI